MVGPLSYNFTLPSGFGVDVNRASGALTIMDPGTGRSMTGQCSANRF
jgi:hypothetical protein